MIRVTQFGSHEWLIRPPLNCLSRASTHTPTLMLIRYAMPPSASIAFNVRRRAPRPMCFPLYSMTMVCLATRLSTNRPTPLLPALRTDVDGNCCCCSARLWHLLLPCLTLQDTHSLGVFCVSEWGVYCSCRRARLTSPLVVVHSRRLHDTGDAERCMHMCALAMWQWKSHYVPCATLLVLVVDLVCCCCSWLHETLWHDVQHMHADVIVSCCFSVVDICVVREPLFDVVENLFHLLGKLGDI